MADRPVRVVHVVWRFSRHAGVQSVVRRLADGIDPSRVELHIIQARAALAQDELDAVPATVHSLGFSPKRRPWHRVMVVWSVARRMWAIRPDVVQFHSGTVWMGLLGWLRHPRMPMVLEVHDAPGSGRHGRLTDRLEGVWVCVSKATLVAHSSAVATQTREAWHVPAERIAMFPLAVDAAGADGAHSPAGAAAGEGTRAQLGIGADSFVMLGLGRLVPSKRFDIMIEVLAGLRDTGVGADLIIVGVGAEDDSLRTVARARGVDGAVHISGRLSEDELDDAFGAADVLCSTSEYEGFGLSLIEAMAWSVPVVAMAAGGVTDIVVDGETGYLVEPGDVAAFVSHLPAMAADGELLERLGHAARARATEVYGPQRMVEAFTEVYLRSRA